MKTLSDVVASDFTPICYIEKTNPQELRLAITQMIGDVIEFFGPKNSNIEPRMALQVAELLIEEYNDMPVESLKIFFRNIKTGTYGKIYNSMSCADFMLWFKEFYQEYWREFYEHKEQEQKKEVKETDEQFISAPESVQRLFNQFAGRGYRTDAECEQARTADQIRKDVISKHSHLYRTMSVDDANRAIDEAIKVALMAEGIFE